MKRNMSGRFKSAAFGLLSVGVVTLSGCTDFAGYDLDRAFGAIEWFAVLREDVSFDPYEMPRLPAEHTIPVASPAGDNQGFFSQAQLDSVAATLSNPLQPTPEVLALGQQVYLNQCAVCHGVEGAGNGTVVGPGKFPFAPAVNGAAGPGRPAAYVYAIVAVGRGLMPPQGYKISDAEQWAVATYVEALQGQVNATTPPAPAPDAAAPAAPVAETESR